MKKAKPTAFAPAETVSAEEIQWQFKMLLGLNCSRLLDALPVVVLILNQHRQLVFANQALLDLLGESNIKSVLGKRPGELFNCIHAREGAHCGTTIFCRHCGALQAILSSVAGEEAEQECRLTRETEDGVESQDLAISCRPIELDEHRFNVLTLQDISHEKRRLALERVFFHDILNLAGAMRTLVTEFSSALPKSLEKIAEVLKIGFHRLVEEIVSQRELVRAERGDLVVEWALEDSLVVLDEMTMIYRAGDLAEGKNVVMDPQSCRVRFSSDPALLRRVLGNMLKNALEASRPGQTVTLGCSSSDGHVELWVHNETVMPSEVQEQVFKRSFSTKGQGRGLGTYGMLLFGEQYLGGEVFFASEVGLGTVFTLRLPLVSRLRHAQGPDSV